MLHQSLLGLIQHVQAVHDFAQMLAEHVILCIEQIYLTRADLVTLERILTKLAFFRVQPLRVQKLFRAESGAIRGLSFAQIHPFRDLEVWHQVLTTDAFDQFHVWTELFKGIVTSEDVLPERFLVQEVHVVTVLGQGRHIFQIFHF